MPKEGETAKDEENEVAKWNICLFIVSFLAFLAPVSFPFYSGKQDLGLSHDTANKEITASNKEENFFFASLFLKWNTWFCTE